MGGGLLRVLLEADVLAHAQLDEAFRLYHLLGTYRKPLVAFVDDDGAVVVGHLLECVDDAILLRLGQRRLLAYRDCSG